MHVYEHHGQPGSRPCLLVDADDLPHGHERLVYCLYLIMMYLEAGFLWKLTDSYTTIHLYGMRTKPKPGRPSGITLHRLFPVAPASLGQLRVI
jgi:hypothetical protein